MFVGFFAAPRVFAFAFGIVKKFLNAYTLSKIQIYKSDQKKWLPKILEKVDISQVPLFYGGTMTGENGDPKCLNKVSSFDISRFHPGSKPGFKVLAKILSQTT